MASVTQCDACGNVIKNEEAKYLSIYKCDTEGNTTFTDTRMDICPECHAKVCKALNKEAKKK